MTKSTLALRTEILARRGVSELLELTRGVLDEGFFVGGLVRDSLAGRHSDDSDIDVMVSHACLLELRRSNLPGLGYNRHGNLRVSTGPVQADIFAPQTFFHGFVSTTSALRFFDIDINALALPVRRGPLIDPLGAASNIARLQFSLVERRWNAESPPMEMAVLRARLLKLMRAFPQFTCLNPAPAEVALEALFEAFPKVVSYHLGTSPVLASTELRARLSGHLRDGHE